MQRDEIATLAHTAWRNCARVRTKEGRMTEREER